MYRIEVSLKSHLSDAGGFGLVKDIHDLGVKTVSGVHVVDIYWLDADLTSDRLDTVCRSLLADPVTQEYQLITSPADIRESWKGRSSSDKVNKQFHTIEVAYNAGVADPVEDTVMKALQDLGVVGVRAVKTARRYLIEGQLGEHQLEAICSRLLVNPIIQHVVEQEEVWFPENPRYRFRLKQIDILQIDDAGLLEVRHQFGFSGDELQAIRGYFRQQERNPTDVELETLAQTWSEHCVHKTF